MLDMICRRWWVLMVRGVVAILLGICALVWPGVTLVALVFVFGAFAILDGAGSIVLGMRGEPDGTIWWTMILLGVLAVIAGILAFAWPELTALVLLAIIAAWAIIRGILEVIAAIRLRKEIQDEWLLALSGVLSVVFGILLIAWPVPGLVVIAWLLGIYMLILGALAVFLSLRLRRMCHHATAHAAPSSTAT